MQASTEIRTHEEVQALCRNWRNDPCWDLETTEGFEAHAPELLEYRFLWEEKWREALDARLLARADDLGVPGNIKLVAYIERLERQIASMNEALENVCFRG